VDAPLTVRQFVEEQVGYFGQVLVGVACNARRGAAPERSRRCNALSAAPRAEVLGDITKFTARVNPRTWSSR
jgi:hypothetical protein